MAVPYSRTVFGGLPWYSVLIVTGMALAVLIADAEGKRRGLGEDVGTDLALAAIPLGIIGARLYYVLLSWKDYAANPVSALFVWEGGLAIYGGVIGGVLGVWLYCRLKKRSFGAMLDLIAPGLILAQAVGRWGNYFNMEAYGPLVSDPRFQFFPLCVKIIGAAGWEWHMAAFFYESVWNLLSFAVLMALRGRIRKNGDQFCRYLLLYGAGRFLIEQLRQDSLYLLGLRASCWLSFLLCIVSAVILMRNAGFLRWVLPPLLAARWLCLKSPLLYLALIAMALIAILFTGHKKRTLIVPFAADAVGLLLHLLWPSSAHFAVHAVLCSASFILITLILDLNEPEEKPCLSEK